jgi:replicative DNA helicase
MEVPAIERMLLNALLSSPGACAEIVPRLTAEMTAGFATREVFEAVGQILSADSPVTVSALLARLSEPGQALLHEVAAADEMDDGTVSIDEARALEQARACLRRLEEAAHKRRLTELRSSIKAAEREGRLQEALGLMAELGRLQRKAEGAEAL